MTVHPAGMDLAGVRPVSNGSFEEEVGAEILWRLGGVPSLKLT